MAERVRKIGGMTLRSIGRYRALQRIKDNEENYVPPVDMLRELMEDNKAVAKAMREAHELCDEHEDVATASMLEIWIDEAEKRTWFLFEASRKPDQTGHCTPYCLRRAGAAGLIRSPAFCQGPL